MGCNGEEAHLSPVEVRRCCRCSIKGNSLRNIGATGHEDMT